MMTTGTIVSKHELHKNLCNQNTSKKSSINSDKTECMLCTLPRFRSLFRAIQITGVATFYINIVKFLKSI